MCAKERAATGENRAFRTKEADLLCVDLSTTLPNALWRREFSEVESARRFEMSER